MIAGVTHLLAPRFFDAIMPRAIPDPAHRPLTYISGAAEICVGVAMLVPRTRRIGGTLTAGLLLAVLPANIDAALRGGYPGLDGFAGSAGFAWARIPLQIPLIIWALSIGRRAEARGSQRTSATDKDTT